MLLELESQRLAAVEKSLQRRVRLGPPVARDWALALLLMVATVECLLPASTAGLDILGTHFLFVVHSLLMLIANCVPHARTQDRRASLQVMRDQMLAGFATNGTLSAAARLLMAKRHNDWSSTSQTNTSSSGHGTQQRLPEGAMTAAAPEAATAPAVDAVGRSSISEAAAVALPSSARSPTSGGFRMVRMTPSDLWELFQTKVAVLGMIPRMCRTGKATVRAVKMVTVGLILKVRLCVCGCVLRVCVVCVCVCECE
jgi:hypothetical protein